MCRHVCPIGLTTGKETHTPRGKAQLCVTIEHGNDVLKESAEAMYACFLCNNCSDWCEVSFEPPRYIRDARRHIVSRDFLPDNIKHVVDAVMEPEGTLYGKKIFPVELVEAVSILPEKAPVLLVLGDTAVMKKPEIAIAIIRLLKKAGVEFTVLKNEPSVGNDLYDLIGDLAEVQEVAKNFMAAAERTGYKTMVVLDPYCAKVLMQDYPRWGIVSDAVIQTATSFIAELIADGKISVKKKENRLVTYHDPSRLARDIDETEPARKIIAVVANNFKEMFLNKNNARCCGNEVTASYAPKIVAGTARMRMDDALRTGAELLITASPACNIILSEAGQSAMAVEDIFILLERSC
jgi:Fe-S oxidoreductase